MIMFILYGALLLQVLLGAVLTGMSLDQRMPEDSRRVALHMSGLALGTGLLLVAAMVVSA